MKQIRETTEWLQKIVETTRSYVDYYMVIYNGEYSEDIPSFLKELQVNGNVTSNQLVTVINNLSDVGSYFMIHDENNEILVKNPRFKDGLKSDIHLLRYYDVPTQIIVEFDALVFRIGLNYSIVNMCDDKHVICMNNERSESVLDGIYYQPHNGLTNCDVSSIDRDHEQYTNSQTLYFAAKHYFKHAFLSKLRRTSSTFNSYFEKAISDYEKSISLCPSNTRNSLLMTYACKYELGHGDFSLVGKFKEIYEQDTSWIEPLLAVAHYARVGNNHQEGYKYGKLALANATLSKTDILFYKFADEVAMCSVYTGRMSESLEWWSAVFNNDNCPDKEASRIMGNMQYVLKQSGKQIICFYTGYAEDMNGKSYKKKEKLYGSEIALVNLAEQFAKTNIVCVFGATCQKDTYYNGVFYKNSRDLINYQKENTIDVMIISRYIHYFIDFPITARKTFVWLHDIHPLSFWNFNNIPQQGKLLLKNMIKQFDGIVCLSTWHKTFIIENYEIPESKVFIVGNGVDVNSFNIDNVDRVQNRFIYTSSPTRGIDKLVEYFPEIKKKIKNASLHIFRDPDGFKPETLDTIKKSDYMFFHGKVEPDKMPIEFLKSDFWFYPTDFDETYCISALEAQLAGCICVCTERGGLIDTVGDKDSLFKIHLIPQNIVQKLLKPFSKFLEMMA